MSRVNFEILFDKEFYILGDTAVVKLVLTTEKLLEINSISAKIWGFLEEPRLRTFSYYNYGHLAHEFKNHYLFTKEEAYMEDTHLNPGEYEFVISHTLPKVAEHLKPQGFKPKFFVSGHVDIPWAIDIKVKSRILALESREVYEELKRRYERGHPSNFK